MNKENNRLCLTLSTVLRIDWKGWLKEEEAIVGVGFNAVVKGARVKG